MGHGHIDHRPLSPGAEMALADGRTDLRRMPTTSVASWEWRLIRTGGPGHGREPASRPPNVSPTLPSGLTKPYYRRPAGPWEQFAIVRLVSTSAPAPRRPGLTAPGAWQAGLARALVSKFVVTTVAPPAAQPWPSQTLYRCARVAVSAGLSDRLPTRRAARGLLASALTNSPVLRFQ